MSAIDTRVVEAKFNNTQFGKGVADTLSSLDRLKQSLRLEGASKGLEDVSAAASRFDASPMEHGAGRIQASFSAMQGIALGALASIGAKAVAVGAQLASSFTVSPILEGFREYETNMNSIQTILANTQASGAGLADVNAALDELNHYSDQTIYNFSEMAKNIGTFTAAGVNLETATGSIKGIANLAALSGSNSEQASGAMYQLSQAISAGKVSLQDWNSVVNAGMGGTVFQRALAQTAQQMGSLSQGSVKLTGDMQNVTIAGKSFRESIDATNGPSWLTSDVLTATLNQFTGDMTDAELAAQGFSAEMIASIQAQAKTAVNAATEVKTFSGLIDTLKEGITSGWSSSFRLIIGDFEEAKQLFTGLSNAAGGFFGRMSDSRNELLQQWKDLGGRTALIEGLTEAFWAFAAPLAQIGAGFREVFPRTTAENLVQTTNAFRDFMVELRPSPETLDRLKRTFAGLFAILGIGWEIIKAVAKFIGDLVLGFTEGDQGILRFTASIGDFLVGLHQAIRDGQGLTSFFDKLRDLIFKILNPIRDLGQFLGMAFEGLDVGNAGKALGDLISGLLTIGDAGDSASGGVSKIKKALDGLGEFFAGMGRKIADWAANIGTFIAGAFGDINYDDLMAGLQTGVLAALTGVLWKLKGSISGFSLFGGGGGGGIFDSIKDGLDNLSGTLGAMQNNLNATALLKLAAAIAILAVSVVLLASVDAPGLARATAALAVMFVQLAAGMKAFNSSVSVMGAAKLNLLGPALIMIGIAIAILSASVKSLAELSWEELSRGMSALAIMLALLAGTVKVMSGNTKGMAAAAVGLLLISVAIKSLVDSVKDLAEMDWGELAKGLTGVGALLISLALFTRFAKAGAAGLAQGAGILLLSMAIENLVNAVTGLAKLTWEELSRGMSGLAVGLVIMAGALRLMPAGPKILIGAFAISKVAEALKFMADTIIELGKVGWEELAKGILALSAGLGIIALSMQLFNKVSFVKMAGIAIVAVAIRLLSEALTSMGAMSYDEIARGLTALAGTLLILTIALKFMQGSIAGALALLVVAGALNVLWPVLAAMSQLSWAEIAAGLGMLAGVFIVIGLAGLVLGPIVPVLLGLGIAIGLLGVAILLAGVGVLAFATGLTLLAAAGAGATVAIVAIVSGLIGLIPMVIEQIGLGIIAFAEVIAKAGPAILKAITTVLTAFLQSIIDITPKVVQTLLTLLFAFLFTLEQAVPRILQAGINILLALLDGIGRNIGQIVDKAVTIIVNFVNAISRNLPRIIQAGIDLILALMNGIGDAARNNGPKLADASWNMVTGIIDGIVSGLGRLGSKFTTALVNLAKSAFNGVLDFFGIGSPSKKMEWVSRMNVLGLAQGVDKYGHIAVDSTENMANDMVTTMGKTLSGLGDMIGADMDTNPVITPILDLSEIQRDASGIGNMLSSAPIQLDGAYAGARNASAGYSANQIAALEKAVGSQANVSFTQNNYSPKALSRIEIYRQTNNQLSRAKGALTSGAK